MEGKDGTGTILNIVVVCKSGQFPGSFVGKANLIFYRHPFQGTVGIAAGLILHNRDIFTGSILFCFHNTDRDSLNEQRIVHGAGAGRKFPHRYTQPGKQIELLPVLHNPSGLC